MSADSPSPEGAGGFPEVRLKAGYRNPVGSSAPADSGAAEETRRDGPLSFDEMLEFTRGAKSTPAPAPARPSPPPAPPAPVYPTPTPPAMPVPEPPAFAAISMDSEPIALNVSPPPPPPMHHIPEVRSPARLLAPQKSSSPERLKQGGLALLGFVTLVFIVLGVSSLFSGPTKVLIKSKPEGAAVYLGEEHLGDTPVEVEIHDLDHMPVLELEGYKTQPVPQFKEPESGEPGKVYVVLERLPFPLDWEGLPKGAKIWWEGAESKPKTTVAGPHDVKIKPTGQSSFVWSVDIPWKDGQAYPIGKAIASELKKRPTLKLTLSGTEKAEVIVKSGSRFTQKVSLKKGASTITLPEPGKYRVKVKATNSYAAFDQEVELKEGSRKSVDVALWQPVAAPASPSYSGGGGGGWSQPSYSAPRSAPRASYSGGGGGGGRIAPPSF